VGRAVYRQGAPACPATQASSSVSSPGVSSSLSRAIE